jgi:hypothetical protein
MDRAKDRDLYIASNALGHLPAVHRTRRSPPLLSCVTAPEHRAGDAVTPSGNKRSAMATHNVRRRARSVLKAYKVHAQLAMLDWLRTRRKGERETPEAFMARWRRHWVNSPEGKQAGDILAQYLASFSTVAATELRRAVMASSAHPGKSLHKTLTALVAQDGARDWEDQFLDRMLADRAAQIQSEWQWRPEVISGARKYRKNSDLE